MTNNLRVIVNGMVRGLQDSLVGILRVYNMDQESELTERTEQSSPSTTLARRRAERKKREPSSAKKQSPPKVFHRIILCCSWNGGVFWMSLFLFYGLVIPGLELLTHFLFGGSSTYTRFWLYTGPMLSWTFSALWVLPLFILSKIVNGFWFQDIADSAYRRSRGRPQLLQNLSTTIADMLFSLILQGLFLIQGMLVKLLPIHGIGDIVYLLHMCLLHSLYAFEYKWFNMGWPIHKRLSYIECNWPYFVGFGLPLALLTFLPSSFVVSGCVFSILFPLFIISANEADPTFEAIDFPLRLFSPVVYVSNLLFQQSVSIKKSSTPSITTTTPKKVTLQEGSSSLTYSRD